MRIDTCFTDCWFLPDSHWVDRGDVRDEPIWVPLSPPGQQYWRYSLIPHPTCQKTRNKTIFTTNESRSNCLFVSRWMFTSAIIEDQEQIYMNWMNVCGTKNRFMWHEWMFLWFLQGEQLHDADGILDMNDSYNYYVSRWISHLRRGKPEVNYCSVGLDYCEQRQTRR